MYIMNDWGGVGYIEMQWSNKTPGTNMTNVYGVRMSPNEMIESPD